ncbi:MAG: IreB family regulatory phosphoprotein [Peptostreptococcaceae bacterium]|nr:IreB family regulatory phosphoprotein [Peptostreptococcaceae bacterium]
MDKLEYTMTFQAQKDNSESEKEIMKKVYAALEEKGYNAINQLVGYFLSGDPSYITSHNNARSLIRRFERDELLEVILKSYIENN